MTPWTFNAYMQLQYHVFVTSGPNVTCQFHILAFQPWISIGYKAGLSLEEVWTWWLIEICLQVLNPFLRNPEIRMAKSESLIILQLNFHVL